MIQSGVLQHACTTPGHGGSFLHGHWVMVHAAARHACAHALGRVSLKVLTNATGAVRSGQRAIYTMLALVDVHAARVSSPWRFEASGPHFTCAKLQAQIWSALAGRACNRSKEKALEAAQNYRSRPRSWSTRALLQAPNPWPWGCTTAMQHRVIRRGALHDEVGADGATALITAPAHA